MPIHRDMVRDAQCRRITPPVRTARQQVGVATLVIAIVVLAIARPIRGDDVLKSWLERKLIDANLPLQEVQVYTEQKVPRMPAIVDLAAWRRHAEQLRRDVLEKVVYRGEAASWRNYNGKVEWLGEIPGGPEYLIKKLRYEALPGLWIPALLYVPKKLVGRVPVVLNVNGHDGNGKAAPYKQIRCINQAKRGMLALNPEWLGMGQLSGQDYQHYRMNQLDLCGTSGLAPFFLAMKRGLDILLSHQHADPKRVAVAGLSGGGWQTITISSLDERVTLADPVAGYSSFRTRARHFSDLGDSEQTPNDLAVVADYAHLTAMMAPRPTLLTFNYADDCCFKSDHALPPLLQAARPIYDLYGEPHRLRWHVNFVPGNHNFERDNREALYRMFRDFFYPGDSSFDSTEIPCDQEVKSREQLDVELPAANQTFHSLSKKISANLPRAAAISTDPKDRARWSEERRAKLREIVRAKDYSVRAESVGSEQKGSLQATFWRLRMDDAWTVGVVEIVSGTPNRTTILVGDSGRAALVETAKQLLQTNCRILAIDPFYFGESRIAQRDFLFALLVAAVGDRPLGIQSSQLAAAARWSMRAHKTGTIDLVAIGPRASLFSLVAAALAPDALKPTKLDGGYSSLRQIIEQNLAVNQTPELFCFGLLEAFDVPQLVALANAATTP
jgi:dienelactone hydrolase